MLRITAFTFVLLCSTDIARGIQDDGTAIDNFIARQAKRERGEEYREARKVLAGDLTHDGKPETVVLYTIEESLTPASAPTARDMIARGKRRRSVAPGL